MVLLGLVAAGAAQAQPGPKERASALFDAANRLYGRKMFLDALHKYREARALYPSFKIDLNIGGTLDALGRRTEAAVYFERFLIQSAAAPPAIIAKARQRLEQLRSKLGRVKVTTLLEGAAIRADGVSVGKAPLDIPVYLEPGEHQLEARKPGAEPVSRAVTVAAGQALTVDLSPVAALPPPASRPARAPASAPVASTGTSAAPSGAEGGREAAPTLARAEPEPLLVQQRRTKTLWAWTSLGVGAAFALTAVVLYGVGGAQSSSAYDRYHEATEPKVITSAWSDVETAQDKVIAGHVLLGVGVVACGIALYQFLTRPALVERRSGLTVTPLAAGATLRGTF